MTRNQKPADNEKSMKQMTIMEMDVDVVMDMVMLPVVPLLKTQSDAAFNFLTPNQINI